MKQVTGAETEAAFYARKANRIAIHAYELGRVVAMIEVISPGNKDSKHAIASFVAKAVDFIRNGIHFLVIDPFPPPARATRTGSPRRSGTNCSASCLLTRTADEASASSPRSTPRSTCTAYVDAVAVGDPLPDSPLFLAPGWYVNVPLEQTYQASWEVTPKPVRDLITQARDVAPRT